MRQVKYLERGVEQDFKRVGDRYVTLRLDRCFVSGGLLYGYRDRFNVVSIPLEDIVSNEEVQS